MSEHSLHEQHTLKSETLFYTKPTCDNTELINKNEFIDYFNLPLSHPMFVFGYSRQIDLNFVFNGLSMKPGCWTDNEKRAAVYACFDTSKTKTNIIYDKAMSKSDYISHQVHIYDILDHTYEKMFDVLFFNLKYDHAGCQPIIPFEDPNYGVTLDVLTLYKILSKRGQCAELIKASILQTFNSFINKMKDFPTALNIYLSYNARALGISNTINCTGSHYIVMIEDYSKDDEMWKPYINNTEPMRKQLILKIQQAIVDMK
jgi:hypothetical protein